jgi:hypothetical protein
VHFAGAPQEHVYFHEELLHVEWLADIIVRAKVVTFEAVVLLVLGADEKDGNYIA